MIDHFDVVGVSHSSTTPFPWTPLPAGWYDPRYSYGYFHAHHPGYPLVASEGSSCNTQRGPNVVDTATGAWDDVFNADCLSKTFCPANTTKAPNEVSDTVSVRGARCGPASAVLLRAFTAPWPRRSPTSKDGLVPHSRKGGRWGGVPVGGGRS